MVAEMGMMTDYSLCSHRDVLADNQILHLYNSENRHGNYFSKTG
jgi:hypothetical protein